MKIAALAGGVGAARLLSGLHRILSADDLAVVVNTGDDFRWMGLYICPDLDTVTYTLAGIANPGTGWGVEGDTFQFLAQLKGLGEDAWFRVGDRDLATHVYRTERLRCGSSLSDVTRTLCMQHGIRSRILPMTDAPVPTLVHTNEGTLAFQDYFVRRQCTPVVAGFTFQGIESSRPAPGVLEILYDADAVIVCPSNPFISIAPILAVPGIRTALRETGATVVAVTPIIGGKAIKGPTAAMLEQLGKETSATSVAALYQDFVDVFILDSYDEYLSSAISTLVPTVRTAPTLMDSTDSQIRLAEIVLQIIGDESSAR